jgi:hypothetical protein
LLARLEARSRLRSVVEDGEGEEEASGGEWEEAGEKLG